MTLGDGEIVGNGRNQIAPSFWRGKAVHTITKENEIIFTSGQVYIGWLGGHQIIIFGISALFNNLPRHTNPNGTAIFGNFQLTKRQKVTGWKQERLASSLKVLMRQKLIGLPSHMISYSHSMRRFIIILDTLIIRLLNLCLRKALLKNFSLMKQKFQFVLAAKSLA